MASFLFNGTAPEAPCEECGGLVDLSAVITVSIQEEDGSEVQAQMTEAEARRLLAEVGLPPLPVICNQHDPGVIETSRD